jgi:hypothetical protein
MARIISHPFRLLGNGTVATVDQSTDEANGEQLAVLALTRRGERVLRSAFGVGIDAFAVFDPTDLAAAVALYGPPVVLTDVEVTPRTETVVDVVVRFE